MDKKIAKPLLMLLIFIIVATGVYLWLNNLAFAFIAALVILVIIK